MTERSMSAIEAIELSQAENRIVHLAPSNVVSADLRVECDGHVVGNDWHEYWGYADHGGEWRVHVRKLAKVG